MLQFQLHRTAFLLASGSLVLATVACSSGSKTESGAAEDSSAATSASATVDPCSLLSANEVSQTLGVNLGQGESKNEDLSASRSCTWTTKSTDYNCAKNLASVTLEAVEPPPALKPRFPTAKAYYPQLISTMKASGGIVSDVPGIGDEAFSRTSADGQGLWLYARKGGSILRVFATCGDQKMLKPKLESLLKQAVAKL